MINPSIVPVTAEHASSACLFRVEELITASQQGAYRQQYMWCVYVTRSEIHANARGYELYRQISRCATQSSHYCRQSEFVTWKLYTRRMGRAPFSDKSQTNASWHLIWFFFFSPTFSVWCLSMRGIILECSQMVKVDDCWISVQFARITCSYLK